MPDTTLPEVSAVDNRRTSVYFIQSGTNGPIKIGVAVDIPSRLQELQVGSPLPLRILGFIPGAGYGEERALHQEFATCCVGGEWFRRSHRLSRVIRDRATPWLERGRYRLPTKASRQSKGGKRGSLPPTPRLVRPDCRHRSSPLERMHCAYTHFERTWGRVPDTAELIQHYAVRYPEDRGAIHRQNTLAAQVCLFRKTSTSLADGASLAGFPASLDSLLNSVRAHCADRMTSYRHRVDDESLAVYLHLVEKVSFQIAREPRRQWSLPGATALAFFRTLKRDGDIRGGCSGPNKLIAIRTILERSQLIQCLDDTYVPAGPARGVGKKWTIGPTHPRYAEFQRWAMAVPWEPAVRRIVIGTRSRGRAAG